MSAKEIPATVREIAAGVANDIRTIGFSEYPANLHPSELWPDGPCCAILNPTMSRLGYEDASSFKWWLSREIGCTASVVSIGEWSDRTGRDGVLEVLDRLARGESLHDSQSDPKLQN